MLPRDHHSAERVLLGLWQKNSYLRFWGEPNFPSYAELDSQSTDNPLNIVLRLCFD